MTCSCKFSEFGGLIASDNEELNFDIAIKTTRSSHVETVVLLSHKKPDSHINVNVEFGEGEGKVPIDKIAERAEAYKPKEKVTYKMIQEYIEKKYSFKVHTAFDHKKAIEAIDILREFSDNSTKPFECDILSDNEFSELMNKYPKKF